MDKNKDKIMMIIVAVILVFVIVVVVINETRTIWNPEKYVRWEIHRPDHTDTDRGIKIYLRVRVTAYNSEPSQTDSTPFEAAWGHRVYDGMIAVSRDLEEIGLTRSLFTFNIVDRDVWVYPVVEIEGREYTIKDRLHRRKRRQLDIWMEHKEDAIKWGVRYCTIKVKNCSKLDVFGLCEEEGILRLSQLNQTLRAT